MAIKNIDFNAEVQYLGNIKGALEQITIRGSEAITYSNILQAIDNLAKAIVEKQKDINTQLAEETKDTTVIK